LRTDGQLLTFCAQSSRTKRSLWPTLMKTVSVLRASSATWISSRMLIKYEETLAKLPDAIKEKIGFKQNTLINRGIYRLVEPTKWTVLVKTCWRLGG